MQKTNAFEVPEGKKLRYSLAKSRLSRGASAHGGFDINASIALLLNQLLVLNRIREIDRSFALFSLQRFQDLESARSLSGEELTLLVMLATLTSEQLSRQHVCLALDEVSQPFVPIFRFPAVDVCRRALSYDLVKSCGLFMFDGERLYLQRYWQYEQQVCRQLNSLTAPEFEPSEIKTHLQSLYPNSTIDKENDWQKNAIALACLKSITVIAGGPGTGKTTTVVRILWMLSKLYRRRRAVNGIPARTNIKMVAPTGKAAARLSESVAGAITSLPDSAEQIPTECSTIHRLLGVVPNSVYFRHDEERPLNIDVLVVDEASMIDLPLLAKMLRALPKHCRVILLGDSHQLASVEVGSVFSDICSLKKGQNGFSTEISRQLQGLTDQHDIHSESCQQLQPYSDFMDNIIFLTKSWRFDANSGIGHLARAVNKGDAQEAIKLLNADLKDLKWFPTTRESELLNAVLGHFHALHKAADDGDIAAAFEQLMQCQILTAQRTGKWGLEHINGLVKQALLQQGLIVSDQEFYSGRPLMITSNDYQNRLFNGDVGLVVRNHKASEEARREVLNVWFQDTVKHSDVTSGNGVGVEANTGFRSLLPAQLPAHETMYAMTTHKSQGSEFTRVIFCLSQSDNETGKSKSSELLNRELLYTGITRAKQEFILFADQYSVTNAVNQVCRRASGLASALVRTGG